MNNPKPRKKSTRKMFYPCQACARVDEATIRELDKLAEKARCLRGTLIRKIIWEAVMAGRFHKK